MIYAMLRMAIPFHRLKEVVETLSSVAQRSRWEEGCIRSAVYQDVELGNVIMLEQLWKSEKDLECFLRSSEYQKILLVADLALASPEIRFDTVVRTTGVETIEKARTCWREKENP